MLMNYHEMTINEPNDSPAKRKQFAVICAVMAACVSYAVMTSGILLPVEVTEGIFPGGNFCYKLSQRDYAASFGLGRRLTKDMLGEGTTRSTSTTDDDDDDDKAKKSSSTSAQRNEVEEITYHLFLDNPHEMGGRRLRWATGILVSDKEKDKVKHLLSLNQPSGKGKGKTKRYPTDEEMIDFSASEVMDLLPYEVADLPSVDSLVAQFPHTHGFVSALVMSYKIIPRMRKLALEKGGKGTSPVVLSTCRKDESMCTIYAPLVQTKDFHMGRPDSETYQKELPDESFFLSYTSVKQGLYKLSPPWVREYIEKLP